MDEKNNVKYVQLEAAAFLTDVDFLLMNAEERGVYSTIIFYLYSGEGKLKCDETALRRLTNCSPDFDFTNVLKKFQVNKKAGIQHKRVTQELTKAKTFIKNKDEWIRKSAAAGKRSARLRAARKKGTHTTSLWLNLVAATKGICPRCNKEADNFHKDHVVPIYQGGSDGIDNIQPLCPRCNEQKGNEHIDFFAEQRLTIPTNVSTKVQPTLQPNTNIRKVKKRKEKKSKDIYSSNNEKEVQEVVKKWNKKASKKCECAGEIMRVGLEFQVCLSQGLVVDDILAAIDNYSKARKVKDSVAGNFKLANFLRRLPEDGKNYQTGYFDIDNFKPHDNKFGRESVTDKMERMKAEGRL